MLVECSFGCLFKTGRRLWFSRWKEEQKSGQGEIRHHYTHGVWLFTCSSELFVCHWVHPDLSTSCSLIEIITHSTSRMLSLWLQVCETRMTHTQKKKPAPGQISIFCVRAFLWVHMFVCAFKWVSLTRSTHILANFGIYVCVYICIAWLDGCVCVLDRPTELYAKVVFLYLDWAPGDKEMWRESTSSKDWPWNRTYICFCEPVHSLLTLFI